MEIALLILALLKRANAASMALEAIAELMKQKEARGEKLTIDDVKRYELPAGVARDILVEAINEAEEQG